MTKDEFDQIRKSFDNGTISYDEIYTLLTEVSRLHNGIRKLPRKWDISAGVGIGFTISYREDEKGNAVDWNEVVKVLEG